MKCIIRKKKQPNYKIHFFHSILFTTNKTINIINLQLIFSIFYFSLVVGLIFVVVIAVFCSLFCKIDRISQDSVSKRVGIEVSNVSLIIEFLLFLNIWNIALLLLLLLLLLLSLFSLRTIFGAVNRCVINGSYDSSIKYSIY